MLEFARQTVEKVLVKGNKQKSNRILIDSYITDTSLIYEIRTKKGFHILQLILYKNAFYFEIINKYNNKHFCITSANYDIGFDYIKQATINSIKILKLINEL